MDSISVKKDGAFPVKYDKTVTLLDQSLKCPQTGNVPAFSGGVKIGEFDISIEFLYAAC